MIQNKHFGNLMKFQINTLIIIFLKLFINV